MTTSPGAATHTEPLVAGARPIPGLTAIDVTAGVAHGPLVDAGGDGDADGTLVPA